MKQYLLFLTGFLLVLPVARGDEPPAMQLEFVRKLREKDYADLALEYLENLAKNPPPTLKIVLPMELARTRIALAHNKEPGQRLALLNAARVELEAFIKANPDRPEAAQARFELARLASQRGKALLSKALRKEDLKTQQEEARPAEVQFIEAGKDLEAAAKLLAGLAANYKNPDAKQEKLVREQLDQDRRQARLERAMAFMEQARTYIDLSGDLNTKRAIIIDQARKAFEEVAGEDKENPICVLAAAWLVRCYQEVQDPGKANAAYKTVLKQTSKEAEPAKRLARYFYMQGIMKDPTFKFEKEPKKKVTPLAKVQEVVRLGQNWLKLYPGYKNTPEGQGVRFELAKAYIEEAQLLSKDPKSAKVAPLYNEAQKLLASVAEGDSDFAEQANQLNLTLSFTRMGQDTPVAKLKDFEECYLKANYEMFMMKKAATQQGQASGPELEKLKKERKVRPKNIALAFNRALRLADSKTPVGKIDEARYFLATAYLLSGDPYRAAVAGESLARENPPHKRSPAAAGFALEAYTAILARDNSEDNRQRFIHLADFILKDRHKQWQNDPVTPVTRFHLAMVYKRDDHFKEAIAQLEQLTPEYPAYTFSQAHLVLMAQAARAKAATEAEKKFYLDKALAALKRIPTLPPAPDPSTATLFFFAQLVYPKLLYADAAQDLQKGNIAKAGAKYQEMGNFTRQLQGQLAKMPVKLKPETANQMAFTLNVLEKAARLGQADVEYRAGNYDKVLAPNLAGGVVEEVKKRGQAPGRIQMVDYKMTGEILGLALRAYVQKGKIEDAKVVLGLLQRLSSGDIDADPTAVLRSLVQELESQVRTLQKAGDQAKLKTTMANFSAFVDQLAASSGKKTLDPADYFFLARLYDSLDQHCKAANLYSKIPPPKFLNKKLGKKEKFTEAEEKEIQTYWYSQVQYARQLRQCPEKKKENLETAYKILLALINHPNARGQLLAEKETIHIIEENGGYSKALSLWGKFMSNPAIKKKLADDPATKEMYFDAYYHLAYCAYKYSQDPKVKAARAKVWLKKAADYILRLENTKDQTDPNQPGEGWQMIGHRFRELLQNEKPLRQQYEELKKQ